MYCLLWVPALHTLITHHHLAVAREVIMDVTEVGARRVLLVVSAVAEQGVEQGVEQEAVEVLVSATPQ